MAEAVAPPSDNPLQLALLSKVILATMGVGSVMVMLAVDGPHPLASVMLTVYVWAERPVLLAVVGELLHV